MRLLAAQAFLFFFTQLAGFVGELPQLFRPGIAVFDGYGLLGQRLDGEQVLADALLAFGLAGAGGIADVPLQEQQLLADLVSLPSQYRFHVGTFL